ncbi:uncharacterized protein BT62DRAFT_729235 [Guyanagaster necrorhizus]|uniref:Uncharacterized protein n=1 Tax=Guyanagaster necrorhizus TaxID=856835 RepID=A0A9P7VXZ9_9AGAR|nr:uncharacterized protein BT62DRAFT_729235 [Guyanagaster necrorhizus MCA 3950]KAG7448810.1 hypothetical protein BT62DRAFT_729235 [Guyanagaster necrorhizus MCA 3950]
MVIREFEGHGAGRVQIDLLHGFSTCVLIANVDGVAMLIVGVKFAGIDLNDGKVQHKLPEFGGAEDGRGPGELPEDTLLLQPPVSGNLPAQVPECFHPRLRPLQIVLCLLALYDGCAVILVLNQLNPFPRIDVVSPSSPILSSMAASFSLKPVVPRTIMFSCALLLFLHWYSLSLSLSTGRTMCRAVTR